jgi:zinc protease
MTVVACGEVDGTAAFWVESGRPTLTATLMFRCGSADESATEAGWQHLLEHLVLHEHAGGGQLSINGEVSLQHTAFDAHGPADEVAAHLTALAEWLSAPSFERMETERRVLAAEAAQRGTAGVPNALSMRFGARGPGIVAFGELGLGRATPDLLRSRAARVFTRENAVLMLDGPPPPGWRLPLPSGQLVSPPAADQIEKFPAGYLDAGLLASGLIRRTPAATILPEALRREFVREFRERLGGAYSPFCGYEYADADHAVAYVGTDINAVDHPDCASIARAVIRTHSQRGPDEGVLAEIISMIIQGIRDPYAQFALARRAGALHLSGEDPGVSLDQVISEYEAVTSEDVRQHAGEFLDTLLLGMPPDATRPSLMRMISQPTAPPRVRPTQGRRHANWPGCLDRLIVDDRGTVLAAGDKAIDYPHADLAAYLTYPSGIRHLVRADGWGLTIDPDEWSGGTDVVTNLDAMVPAELHAPQRDPLGRQPFKRSGFWRRHQAMWGIDLKDPSLRADPAARLLAEGSVWLIGAVVVVGIGVVVALQLGVSAERIVKYLAVMVAVQIGMAFAFRTRDGDE